MQNKEILTKTIQEINIDPTFKVQAKKMGITTLKDVFDMDLIELKKNGHFTMMWYTKLLKILKEKKLLDDFQNKLYD